MDNDDLSTSSSSQDESEEANLCLMAIYESSSSSKVSFLDLSDYNQLLHDFKELHNEANKISALNNRLKDLNNWLKNRVSQLEKETADLKTNFEHLKMIYSNSTDYFRNQPVEIPYKDLCKVHKRESKLRGYSWFSKLCVWQSWTWLQSFFSKENQEVL